MFLQGGRAFARLSSLTSQCLDKRISLACNIARVTSQRQLCYAGHDLSCPPRSILETIAPYRLYATNAVSRPKAHTGRTTSAPRKRATAPKVTSDKATSSTKKPAPKKAPAKRKAKPRTKAKSTKSRKKAVKPKAKKKPKKQLTPEQKQKASVANLKKIALTPPKQLPYTAFSVMLSEAAKAERPTVSRGEAGSIAKACSARYRSLTPEEREHYNHIANQNALANKSAYGQWVRSFTPTQIHEANNARLALKRQTSHPRGWPKLHDERLVKRIRNSFNDFYVQRYKSGDFAGMKMTDAAKLVAAEWRGLSPDEKKIYSQTMEEDSARYREEAKAVYNRDVPVKAAQAA